MKILDSKLWSLGTRVYDLIIINLLWMIFSIPLITIGPATYAGLKCIKEIENNSSDNIFILYIAYFKENFIAYALGFNTFFGVLIVFTKLLTDTFNTSNVILIGFYIFIVVESILSIGVILLIEEKSPIDLIIKSIIYGNQNIMKVLLNLIICISIIVIAISIPVLMMIAISLCLFTTYKILY
ncbi:DUF624 domain-containing protein [Clostridium sp.]|uniref:DUF624 domain-containing protein n=1 Tax=Clostridium sp. TaxID=1506 RepID=UPI003F418111